MLKAAGILTVIAVASLFGLRAANRLITRHKNLGLFVRFFSIAEDKIRCGRSLSELVNEESIKGIVSYGNYRFKFCKEGLSTDEITLLEDFFLKLGLGDTLSQTELCRVYKEMMLKKEKEAEQKVAKEAKLYSLLGLFSGLFVAVMLI